MRENNYEPITFRKHYVTGIGGIGHIEYSIEKNGEIFTSQTKGESIGLFTELLDATPSKVTFRADVEGLESGQYLDLREIFDNFTVPLKKMVDRHNKTH